MDNPVFFTVLASDDEGLSLTDAGILGSRIVAETEAARRHDRLPGLRHVPAIITRTPPRGLPCRIWRRQTRQALPWPR
jgi:hypothetical protein